MPTIHLHHLHLRFPYEDIALLLHLHYTTCTHKEIYRGGSLHIASARGSVNDIHQPANQCIKKQNNPEVQFSFDKLISMGDLRSDL